MQKIVVKEKRSEGAEFNPPFPPAFFLLPRVPEKKSLCPWGILKNKRKERKNKVCRGLADSDTD